MLVVSSTMGIALHSNCLSLYTAIWCIHINSISVSYPSFVSTGLLVQTLVWTLVCAVCWMPTGETNGSMLRTHTADSAATCMCAFGRALASWKIVPNQMQADARYIYVSTSGSRTTIYTHNTPSWTTVVYAKRPTTAAVPPTGIDTAVNLLLPYFVKGSYCICE